MTGNGQQIATIEASQVPALEIAPSNVKAHLENIRQFHEALLEHLKEGHDYAVIPGTNNQKSLLQPGAEKVMRFFQARPRHILVNKVEDWEKPFFFYHYKTEIVHVGTGLVIGEGEGMCSSAEDKYAYRWVYESDLPSHLRGEDGKPLKSVPVKQRNSKNGGKYSVYRVNNEEVASLQNTIMQMAMKRSDVKGNRTMGCLSGLFTQDLEDLRHVIDIGEDEEPARESKQEPAPRQPKAQAAKPKAKPEVSPEERKAERLKYLRNWIKKEWWNEPGAAEGEDTFEICEKLSQIVKAEVESAEDFVSNNEYWDKFTVYAQELALEKEQHREV